MAETDVRVLADKLHDAASCNPPFATLMTEAGNYLDRLSRPPQPEVSGDTLREGDEITIRVRFVRWCNPISQEWDPPPHSSDRIAQVMIEHPFVGWTHIHEVVASSVAAARSPSAPTGEGRCVGGLPDCGPPVASRFEDAPLVCQRCDNAEYAAQVREGFAAPSDPPREVERYREALAEITKLPELSRDPVDDFGRGARAARLDAAEIARAALQPEA